MEDSKIPSWNDRNEEIKRYRFKSSFGWMHLVIARRKEDGVKFLRLKRYMNWFSIPSEKYLSAIYKILDKGALELNWIKDSDISLKEENINNNDANSSNSEIGLPEDLIEFIESNPKSVENILNLIIANSKEVNNITDLVDLLSKFLNKSNQLYISESKKLLSVIANSDNTTVSKLNSFLKSYNLKQVTEIYELVSKRLNEIELFEQLILDDKTYEIKGDGSIHRTLENNLWLLDEKYWLVQSNKSLRKLIGDDILKKDKSHSSKRPDFVCSDFQNKLIIVEIKRPSIELKEEELSQIELYARIAKKHTNKKIIDCYLIGNKISDEVKDILEFRRGIKIMTYSDLLSDCKFRYKEYLKVIEK
ncbi:MAG: hypothetical protein PHN22_05005 [Candidatus ainarchaeum sp.]|nr:hypothetical protein [Candidatus ainarchaeum sp.]